MPPVIDAGDSTGWGCTCPAFRLGEPTPEQVVKALARAANVKVLDQGEQGGYHRFVAQDKYQVSFGPGAGGWCKHILACQGFLWLDQAATGINELLTLQKENRKLQREVTRWKKKSTD